MAKAKKLADALKKVKTSVKEGMTKSQIKKRAAEKKEEVSQLKAKLKDQAKFDASSKSSFKGKTPDKSSKSQAIETRKVNERNKRLQREADSKSKKTKDLDDENSAPLKFKDGSGKVGVGARIKDLAGKAVRGAYRKATPQLQVANRIAQFVKPESGIAKAIKSVAQPTLPSGGKKSSKAKATPVKKSTKKVLRAFDPKNNNAARRKSSKGKVGKNRESDTSNFESLRPTIATPGEAIAPKTRRMPARMKGGGLAIKGQGKAFLKSTR